MNSAIMILENAAKLYGGRTALEMGDETLTYSELRRVARAIGTALLAARPENGGVNPVAVLLPKGLAAIASFMGALYSGSPYAPLDYNAPRLRLGKTLDNLSPCRVITDEAGKAAFDRTGGVLVYSEIAETAEDASAVDRAVALVTDSDPVYIMHTSGSTGAPKGVVIPHRGVSDFARWVVRAFGVTPETVMGNQAPFHFDNSVLDIYGAFSAGARLVIIPETLFLYPSKIPEYINEKKITSVFFVPTVMVGIANSGALSKHAMPRLEKILFCGEVMPARQLNIWKSSHPNALYANLYGPTEVTDVCAYYIIDRGFADADALPIGRPCENMGIVILNDENKKASPGELGELCVLGSGLALGYWNAPDMTRAVFCQNPLNARYDERMYRTGDLAFWGDDGLIRFAGRKDSQIKLKGNRIELGEIENAIKNTDGVENACVLFDAQRGEIAAFVQTRECLTVRALCKRLSAHIPAYMLPSKLRAMSRLPLTPNGKIDRAALKDTLKDG